MPQKTQDKLPRQNDNAIDLTADFTQLVETGRAIWPTYFNLASMTFAWNASLAAGFGAMAFLNLNNESPLAGTSSTLVAQYSAMLIALIGVIYNLGAMSAYRLMIFATTEVVKELSSYSKNQSDLVVPRLMQNVNREGVGILRHLLKRPLKFLTLCFFSLLTIAWCIASIHVAKIILLD